MHYQDLISARHSVRKFTEQKPERTLLEQLIEEAQTAPSSKNCRSSRFLIVEDAPTLKTISQMRERGSAFVAGAPAAIVVMGDSSVTDLWVDNAAISATFLMLSAVDHGLGSCWVHVNGRVRSKSDPSLGYAEDYLRDLLGISPETRILCVIALGYEDKKTINNQ